VNDLIPLPGALTPYLNASGFFGYTPSNSSPLADHLGAFITPPISKTPRSPAANRCLVEYPGGFLLHTGLPNDGFSRITKEHQQKWAGLRVPVWPHLVPQNAWECQQMVRACEDFENVSAVELRLPPDASPAQIEEWLQASVGELPIYVCVALNSSCQELLGVFTLYNVSGIVLSAPRGSVFNNGSLVSGRLYGPSLFPQMLAELHSNRDCGIPIIAGSGIFNFEQAEMALKAGASAVQFDACLWQLALLTSP
jgi:dihydroorotate dehydrogenase